MKHIFDYLRQVLAIGLIFVSVILFVKILENYNLDKSLASWIARREGWAGPAFVLICAALYSIAFSANMLGAIAYLLFGPLEGFLLLSTAGILSSIGLFIIARLLFYNPFQKWLQKKPRWLQVQAALQDKGTLFLCVIRFLPIHAAFINMLLALSPIRFWQFLISLCGMLPQWLLFVYFGYCAAEAAKSPAGLFSTPNIIRYISISLFIIILVYVSRLVQRTLRDSHSVETHL